MLNLLKLKQGMLKYLLICSLAFTATAYARGLPIWMQDNYRWWGQVQNQHLQTQQQLQMQDQYRRQLLLQDQDRQIQKIKDQQDALEDAQRSLLMHGYSNRLRIYSRQLNKNKAVGKRKK